MRRTSSEQCRHVFISFLLFSAFLSYEKNNLTSFIKHKTARVSVQALAAACPLDHAVCQIHIVHYNCVIGVQDLRPRGQDVLKEELGYVVDKEMVATSTAIEEAVLRMDVRTGGLLHSLPHPWPDKTDGEHILNVFCFFVFFFKFHTAGDPEPE